MKNKVYLSRKVLENSELDGKAIGTYIALRSLYNNSNKSEICVTVNSLCYELLGHLNASRKFKENVNSGLSTLIEKNYIKMVGQKEKNYVIDVSQLYIKNVSEEKNKEYYVAIESKELHKIFNSEKRTDKFALTRLYTIMLATIDFNASISDVKDRMQIKTNFVGYMPQEYLAGQAQIAKSSCTSYISDLEELKLIFVYRHKIHVEEDGTVKKLNNNYGRFCNADLITAYATNLREYGWSEQHKEREKKSNYGRSMTQKYNCMCKGKEYDEKTKQEIYSYIHAKNIELKSMVESCETEGYKQKLLSQIKDESVFEVKQLINKIA